MKILLVAATAKELTPIQRKLEREQPAHDIFNLVTGIGMIATTFQLTKTLNEERFDLVINLGIAGAFDRTLTLGEVVEVIRDQFSEEVVEDGDELKTYEEISLRETDKFPFKKGRLHSSYQIQNAKLAKVTGITVNAVHGNEQSIKSIVKRLNPQIESMEGAAFFYVCSQFKTPATQIRAISNYVEKRDRETWEVELALNNLAEATKTILSTL
tara:strand:- start:8315 stop:8953 length:639 start_codon:yes stop_codon:yes gene_type:complete